MKLKSVVWLIFFLINYVSSGRAQSFSIPNLLSKLTIPSFESVTTPAPRTLPSIRFNIEPAQNTGDCRGPQSRTVPEPLLPLLSSMYSQLSETPKQSPVNIPNRSDFPDLARLRNRARLTTEESDVNTHVYLYTAPEENSELDKAEQFLTNYPPKPQQIVLIKDPAVNLQNPGISFGNHAHPETTLIYLVNKHPTVENIIIEGASIPRHPRIHLVNYVPVESMPYIQENYQANPHLAQILSQVIGNPKSNLASAQQHFPVSLLQTISPEVIGNYLQNAPTHLTFSTPSILPFNQLPIPPYFPPLGYIPIPSTQLIPPHSTNAANLLANTLPTILQRISNAPTPVESGTEFRLKLKGLI